MSNYRNLKVWQRAMDFVTKVYEVTNRFPPYELYGLTSQIRRAATSIPLNIAEGAASGYDTEYQRFLRLAIRSASEVATGFEIAKRLQYCAEAEAVRCIQEADEIAAMLQGLVKSLKKINESPEYYFTNDLTTSD